MLKRWTVLSFKQQNIHKGCQRENNGGSRHGIKIKQDQTDSSGRRVGSLFRIQIQCTFKEPVCKCFIVKI